MFWDKVSGVYDLFENIYNKSVYQSTGESVAKYIKNTDRVLENIRSKMIQFNISRMCA